MLCAAAAADRDGQLAERAVSGSMRFGHHANSWGGVVGHPVGVTSIKDLFYLTPGDTLGTLGEVADDGYDGVELFDGNLAEFADDLGTLRAGLDEHGLSLIAVYSGAN